MGSTEFMDSTESMDSMGSMGSVDSMEAMESMDSMQSMESMDSMESILSMELLDSMVYSMVSDSDRFSRMRFESHAFSVAFLRFTFSTSDSTFQAFHFIALRGAIQKIVSNRAFHDSRLKHLRS